MFSLAVWVIVPFALGFILAVLCEGVMYWILRNWDSQDAKKRRTREYFWKWLIVHLLLLGPLLILAFALLQMAPFFFSGIIGGEIYFYLRKNPHRLRADDGPQGEVEPFNPFDDDRGSQEVERGCSNNQSTRKMRSSEVLLRDGLEPLKKENISLGKVLLVVFAIPVVILFLVPAIVWMSDNSIGEPAEQINVMLEDELVSVDHIAIERVAGTYEVIEMFHVLDDLIARINFEGSIRYTFSSSLTIKIEHMTERQLPEAWGTIRVNRGEVDIIDELSALSTNDFLGAEIYQITVHNIDDPAHLLSGATEFDMFLIFADDGDVIIYIPALNEVSLAREV